MLNQVHMASARRMTADSGKKAVVTWVAVPTLANNLTYLSALVQMYAVSP
jgi:hypothetical protein